MSRGLAFALVLGLLAPAGRAEESRPAEAEGQSIVHWGERVRNGSREERARALRIIRRAGPEAEAAIPRLIDGLVRPSDARREEIVLALVAIGESAVPSLTLGMSDSSATVRIWCAKALGRIGSGSASVMAVLAAALEADAHPLERLAAAVALGRIGPVAAPAVEALEAAARSSDGTLSGSAVQALRRIGEAGRPALERLARRVEEAPGRLAPRDLRRPGAPASWDFSGHVRALRWGIEADRVKAAWALGSLRSEAGAAVPELLMAAQDPSDRVRHAAILALGRIGPPAASETLPDLAEWIADPGVGATAALAVTRFGAAGLAVLDRALHHGPWRVRARAARVVREVRVPASDLLPVLLGALEDESSAVRWEAVRSLTDLGPAARPAVPNLRKALADSREDIRVAAALALFAIGHRADDLAPPLVEGLTSPTSDLTVRATDCLITLGSTAVPALEEALLRANEVAAREITSVLGAIGEPAVASLLAGTSAARPGVRRASILALRFFDEDERVTLALEARLEDEDKRVRHRAKWLLEERRTR